MKYKNATLVTSPTSTIGRAFVEMVASKGDNLILLNWRSDLTEALMFETLKKFNITVMIVRDDLARIMDIVKLARDVKNAKLVVTQIISIPLVEGNTPPFDDTPKVLQEKIMAISSTLARLQQQFSDAKVLNLGTLPSILRYRFGHAILSQVTVREARIIVELFLRLGVWGSIGYILPIARLGLLQWSKLWQ